jgi:hypothetical protein
MRNRCWLPVVVVMALAPLAGCAPVSATQSRAMQQKMQNIDQEQGQPMESNGPLGYNTTVHR